MEHRFQQRNASDKKLCFIVSFGLDGVFTFRLIFNEPKQVSAFLRILLTQKFYSNMLIFNMKKKFIDSELCKKYVCFIQSSSPMTHFLSFNARRSKDHDHTPMQ